METQTTQNEKIQASRKAGGLMFVGSMFLGMAAGWFFGHFIIGMFAGMGIGFIMMAVVIASQAAKK